MNCPQCGTPLAAYTELVFGSRATGTDVYRQTGWDECEDCAQEAALLRLAGNRPTVDPVAMIDDADDLSHRYYTLMED